MPLYYPPLDAFRVVAASAATGMTISSGTAEVVLATYSMPAGAMGANGILRITSQWTHTNSVNNKTLRIRGGGLAGTAVWCAPVFTTTLTSQLQHIISNRNSESAQVVHTNGTNTIFGSIVGGVTTTTLNTAVAQDIVLTGQPASAGETITLDRYVIELLYKV